MFTGLIEEVGTIAGIEPGSESATLTIGCQKVLPGTQIGDSISVAGVCLTVTSLGANAWQAQAVAETLRRTTLGDLQPGDPVNLERTLAAGARFGGHFVQGHVDGVGTVTDIVPEGDSVLMTVAAPAAVMRYVVEKGSIAIDGTSLTVADRAADKFTVALIPHTLAATTFGRRRPGDRVNLEADILGKYVDHLLQQREGVSTGEQ